MFNYPKRKLNMGLAVILAISLVLAPALPVYSQNTMPAKVMDNELVVCQMGDNGQVQDIKVLDHLRVFGSGDYVVNDESKFGLSSLRNLYGRDAIQQKDKQISLKMSLSPGEQFKDVYYLAELDKKEITGAKMPVSIQLEYYLDGKRVQPSDISGKSGHLKIVARMENLTGQTKTLEFTNSKGEKLNKDTMVYTPYVVSLSGWEFDNRMFSGVQAPGKAGVCPEGVIVNAQGITTVTWSVPLIPPKYPAKQYTVLEADGKNIELPSFKIAVIPILPTTAEVDNMGTIQESFNMLYDGFDQIQNGIGAKEKNQTILFGLHAVKDGAQQISSGLNTLISKVKQIRFGLSNPAFDSKSYDMFKGTDAQGDTPGVRDAIGLLQASVDGKLVPALKLQKMVLGTMEQSIGTAADQGQQPSATTSLYNDINYLKKTVAGTPSEKVITDTIEPKINAMSKNVVAFRDGGNMVTASGSMAFPASVTALEMGVGMMSTSLKKVNDGLGLMVMGVGDVDKNGQPVKVMINGQPGTLLFALSYMGEAIDDKLIPGVTQLQEGAGLIGDGAGEAKDAIAQGLQTFESIGALTSALEDNAANADTFLGKAEGAQGTVVYVFQTPEISTAGNAMKYGAGVIVAALIILLAVGRPPKSVFHATDESV